MASCNFCGQDKRTRALTNLQVRSRLKAMRAIESRNMNPGGFMDASDERPKESFGFAWLFLLAPLVCCLAPLVVGALAIASAATLGAIGGVIGGLAMGFAVFWILRHRRCRRVACTTSESKVA